MKYILSVSVLCLVVASAASAQDYGYAPAYSGQTVVNTPQAVVNTPQTVVTPTPAPLVPVVPNHVPLPPPPSTVPAGLPVHEWHSGLRESFTHTDVHEIRPIREWENSPGYYPQQPQPSTWYPANGAYPNSAYPANQGWYYYPPTGCYQRDVQPNWYCPQQQTYCPATTTTYCPQRSYYCVPVQPQYQQYQQYRPVWQGLFNW